MVSRREVDGQSKGGIVAYLVQDVGGSVELTPLTVVGLVEVCPDGLLFRQWGLEGPVVLPQLLLLGLREVVAVVLTVEGVGLGVDALVVERMFPGRDDALHLEGQPSAVAGHVGEELHVVARAAEGCHMGHVLRIVAEGLAFVDRRHRHHRLHRVHVGRAHHVELLVAYEAVLRQRDEVVLRHAARVDLDAEVVAQLWRQQM